MPRVLHILIVLVAVAGCETVNAQSISQGAGVDPAAASFSRAHDALERTVDGLLKAVAEPTLFRPKGRADCGN